METHWVSSNLDGQKIWDHYDHDIVIDKYDMGDGNFEYTLACEDCQEVILSAATDEPDHKMLRYLRTMAEKGYKISFDREGGRYGWVGYETNDYVVQWVPVARSKVLI